MLKKKIITWLLMCIALLIVAIPTIPHHHHNATTICLNSPEYNDDGDPRIPIDHKACDNNCITHIKAVKSDTGKPITFEQINLQLFNIQFTECILSSLSNLANNRDYPMLYIESIHLIPPISSHGLRAPPVIIA